MEIKEAIIDKGIKKIQEKLVDQIDEYFPKIKPEGPNPGRGESAVIVGIALYEFGKLLEKRKLEIVKTLIKKIEKEGVKVEGKGEQYIIDISELKKQVGLLLRKP